VTDPSEERPKGLLPLRVWLLQWRERLMREPVPTSQYAQEIVTIDCELGEIDERVRRTSFAVLSKLPVCEECGEFALYVLRHGPFLCVEHAGEHPTAQKVAWYDEAKALGLAKGS
jgi:hypothetical protein